MNRNLIALIATLTSAVATPAVAVDHVVHIVQRGYFPETIYVLATDRITFVNKTGYWARVSECNLSYDLSDWIFPGRNIHTVGCGYSGR